MATRTDIFAGTVYPSFNGTYGAVTARCRVDLAAIIAEFGAISTGDVLKLFTLPKGFKPISGGLTVIKADTGSGTLTARLGSTAYGVATERNLKAAAGTVVDQSPEAPTMIADDTEVTVVLTGTTATDAEFEVVIIGHRLTAQPGEV